MSTPRIPNTIIIASGKGGVGKTWFSISLAHALAHKKKRVLLFDGDLGLANIDIQLGLNLKRDLGHVMEEKSTLQDAILPLEFKNEVKIDVISGKSGTGTFSLLSKNAITNLRESIKTVASKYDHIIFDLSAGLDQIIHEISSFGSQCLVVVTDEPTSLTDAFAFIKVMGHHNPTLPIQIIVNMAKSKEKGKETYNNLAKVCEKLLGRTPTLGGIIHQDTCVRDSIRKKKSTLSQHPRSKAATDVLKIAKDYAPEKVFYNVDEED